MSLFTARLLRAAALGVAFAAIANIAAAETLRLRADSWMPYNGDASAKEAPPGYVVEIVKKIFEPQGITIDYRNMPWGEALKAAASGEIDGVIGANRDEAVGLVLPAEPAGAPGVGLFVRKGSTWRYENVPALIKARLGVVLDYKYWEALDRYISAHDAPHVVKFSGEHPLADALTRLDAGEIDVVVESMPVLLWTLREKGQSAADFPRVYEHESDPIYVAFAPRGDSGACYARLFDEGLRRLRKSGELAAILSRYGLLDWVR